MKRILIALTLILTFVSPALATNATDQNPLILDSTGVISTKPIYVVSAIWHQCMTDGDELSLYDRAGGDEIGYAVCVEGTSVRVWDNEKEVTKLYVDKIDSGRLFIEILNSVPVGHNSPVVP